MLLAVAASYLPVLGAPFVWDDQHLIGESPAVQTLRPLPEYFSRGFWQDDDLMQGRTYYRPLTILSLALDHRLSGNTPSAFHLTNLIIHLVSCWLLYALLRARGAGGNAAVLGMGLWALHPRLSEAVAWVSGRTDLLAGCFVLAALLVRERGTRLARAACGGFLLCGLLSKEVAFAGIAAVIAMELREPGPLRLRSLRAVPALLALLAYAALRAGSSDVSSVNEQTLRSSPFLRVTATVGHYFTMLLCPWTPNLQIGRLDAPRLSYAILGCLVSAALAAWLIRRRGRIPSKLLGPLVLAAFGVGAVLHVVPFSINVIAADRFLYLPLAGLVLALVPVAERAAVARRAAMAGAACAVLLVSFGVATFVRAGDWADEVALWAKTYRDTPDNPKLACTELGRLYARAGLFEHSLSIGLRCTQHVSDRSELINNAATQLARIGRYRAAVQLQDTIGPRLSTIPVFRLNQARFQSYANDFPGAHVALDRALAIAPPYAPALAFRQQLPALEAERRRIDALPESATLERARGFVDLGMAFEAARAFRAAIDEPTLPRAACEEGVRFALLQADATTAALIVSRYATRFGRDVDPELALAATTRHDLAQRLLEVWPSLGLELLALPG